MRNFHPPFMIQWVTSVPTSQPPCALFSPYTPQERQRRPRPWARRAHEAELSVFCICAVLKCRLCCSAYMLQCRHLHLQHVGTALCHARWLKKRACVVSPLPLSCPLVGPRGRSTYDTPKVRQYICTMQVPVRPGVSRVYTKFGYGPPVKQEEPQPAAGTTPTTTTTTAAPASGADSSDKGSSKGSNSSMASLGSAVKEQQPAKAGSGGEMAKPTPETKGNVLVTLMRHLFKQKAVGKPAHWLFDFQLISDQDVIMMCRCVEWGGGKRARG